MGQGCGRDGNSLESCRSDALADWRARDGKASRCCALFIVEWTNGDSDEREERQCCDEEERFRAEELTTVAIGCGDYGWYSCVYAGLCFTL